jgi:hypothetical protein
VNRACVLKIEVACDQNNERLAGGGSKRSSILQRQRVVLPDSLSIVIAAVVGYVT